MMLFYHICFTILLHLVSVSESEESNVSLRTHLERQNKLFSILYHVHQPSFSQEPNQIASAWSLEEHQADFTKGDVVPKFIHRYKEGLLPKEAAFTPFYESHLEEAIALFRLLFYAKDWDTFYKTLAWARKNVNSRMLVYALYVAADHREDCKYLVLPPIYEVNPHLFIDRGILREVKFSKSKFDYSLAHGSSKNDLELMEHDPDKKRYQKTEALNNISLTIDYFKAASGLYEYKGGETPLAYLYKDIAINAMYYYFNIRYPLWMSSKEFELHPRRGETVLHFYQQLSARYHLERASAGLPEISEVDFDGVVDDQFCPALEYPNGQGMPTREGGPIDLSVYYPKYSELASDQVHIYSNTFLLDSERRIRDAIDIGYVLARNGSELPLYKNITKGVNLIGNMIDGNADSPNQPFYGSLMYHARHLLGYPKQDFEDGPLAPCAVEQFETSLRDTLFWKFIKKIVNLYQRYLYHLPPYTLEDLVVPDVKIEGVDAGKLIKRTELFDVDLINAVNHTESEKFGDFEARLHQVRPKPDTFTYKIHIQSESARELCFKVFIGPAHNHHMKPVRLSKHRMNMFLLDKFTYGLHEGSNTVERNITDSPYFTSDDRMFSETYRKIISVAAGNITYKLETFDLSTTYAWPLRFALPLGKTGGYQLKLFVATFEEDGTEEEPLSMLYPFDRPIKNEKMFRNVPNFDAHTISVAQDRCMGLSGCS